MLDNPRVTPTKFKPSETKLEGATVLGRCEIKGRIGSCIGLVLVDDDDNKFVAYLFEDRYIVIPENPDGREKNEQEEKTASEKEADKKEADKKRK